MEDDQYLVVEFLKTDTLEDNQADPPTYVATICKKWTSIDNDGVLSCFWPPLNKLNKARASREIPDCISWEQHQIKILASCSDLITALAKERQAECMSSLSQSEPEKNRGRGQRMKRKPKRIFSSSSDSDEDESDLPTPNLTPVKKSCLKTTPMKPSNKKSNKPSASKSTTKSNFPTKTNPPQTTPRPSSPPINFASQDVFTPPHNTSFLGSAMPIEKEIQQLKDRVYKIEKVVTTMSLDVREGLEILRALRNSQLSASASTAPTLPDNADLEELRESLPLKTVEEVEEFEAKLRDEDTKKVVCEYLMTIGGHSIDDNVKRILVRLFTNDAAQHFSWEGKSGKRRLNQLIIIKLMSRVISGGPLKKTYTDKAFETRLREWFRQAKTRLRAKETRNTARPQN